MKGLQGLRTLVTPCALSLAVGLSGCGLGSAGIVSAASDSSSSNAATQISNFAVTGAKSEPAQVSFVLADEESNAARVQVFYRMGSDVPVALDGDAGVMTLTTKPGAGEEYQFDWPFAADLGEHLTSDVLVYAKVFGVLEVSDVVNEARVDMSNDPPVIVDEDGDGFADTELPPDDVAGIAHVVFKVSDSSADQVDVFVEYAVVDGLDLAGGELPGDQDFLVATSEAEPLVEVQVHEIGTSIDFFWNVQADLPDAEHDVVLRFTADDGVIDDDGQPTGISAAVMTPSFRVDNNAAPIASLDGAAFVVNPDRRRGIPVPFCITDEESDEVELVFQWRVPGEDFPDLPPDPALVNEILLDPALRAQYRIATEFATSVEGKVVPVDEVEDPDRRSIRLPELAAGAATFHGGVPGFLVGRELEILRGSRYLRLLSTLWSESPLAAPAAVLPVSDGLRALVLDRPRPGTWSLAEIDLATGEVMRLVTSSSSGDPNAMVYERGHTSVLIASDVNGSWRLQRVELGTGAVEPLHATDGSIDLGPVRGMAVAAKDAVLLTVGSSLVRVDLGSAPQAEETPVIVGLHSPWGLALDPIDTSRIFLAERDAPGETSPGRLSVVDLKTRSREVLSISPPLPRVESLAFAAQGRRLMAVVDQDPGDGKHELCAIELGTPGAYTSGEFSSQLPGAVGGLATGPDGLILVPLTDEPELMAGSGLE